MESPKSRNFCAYQIYFCFSWYPFRLLAELTLFEEFPALSDRVDCLPYFPCHKDECKLLDKCSNPVNKLTTEEKSNVVFASSLTHPGFETTSCRSLNFSGDEMIICLKPEEEDMVVSANIRHIVSESLLSLCECIYEPLILM